MSRKRKNIIVGLKHEVSSVLVLTTMAFHVLSANQLAAQTSNGFKTEVSTISGETEFLVSNEVYDEFAETSAGKFEYLYSSKDGVQDLQIYLDASSTDSVELIVKFVNLGSQEKIRGTVVLALDGFAKIADMEWTIISPNRKSRSVKDNHLGNSDFKLEVEGMFLSVNSDQNGKRRIQVKGNSTNAMFNLAISEKMDDWELTFERNGT